MSTITVAPEELLAATVSQVKELLDAARKDGRKFTTAHDGLKAALDARNATDIKRYRALLDKARQMLDLDMTDVQYTQESIDRLRADATLKATHPAQVEKLAKAVDHARRIFIERVERARALDARADGAAASILQGQREAEVAIGALRLRVRGTLRTLTGALPEAERLAAAARKAHDQKNQKALTDARTQLIELKAFDGNVLRLRPEVRKLVKQFPDLGRAQKAEVQWMLDDLERVQDVPATIDRLVKETMALGQVRAEPRKPALGNGDVQKVLEAFGLSKSQAQRAKVARFLADEPVNTWPRALAKLYSCNEADLRARLGAVRRLAFVRSRDVELIDI